MIFEGSGFDLCAGPSAYRLKSSLVPEVDVSFSPHQVKLTWKMTLNGAGILTESLLIKVTSVYFTVTLPLYFPLFSDPPPQTFPVSIGCLATRAAIPHFELTCSSTLLCDMFPS
jgi:hypothetical protein